MLDVTVEVRGLTLARLVRQKDHTGAASAISPGLVESHLALLANADHKEIQFTCGFVELGAVVGNLLLGNRTVRNMDILLLHVDMVKQFGAQTMVAALHCVRGHGIILVHGEHLNVRE